MDLTPYQSTLPMMNDPASRQGYASRDVSHTQAASATQKQRLEMELVTAEGDRVTLSLESQSHVLAVSYAEMHSMPCQVSFSKSELFASDQERSVTLTVDGDLNEQEQKDLHNVLKTLKKMYAGLDAREAG